VRTLQVILFYVILTPLISAETIIFQSDFQTLPEFWFTRGWSFGADGATMAASGPEWESTLFTAGEDSLAMRAIYFVPDGTDSISVLIPYYLYIMVNEGSAVFSVSIITESPDPITIWRERIFWMGGMSEHGSIEIFLDWNSSRNGNWMGFSFESAGGHGPGGSVNVLWRLYGITATAYGDSQELHSTTWGSIKPSYRI